MNAALTKSDKPTIGVRRTTFDAKHETWITVYDGREQQLDTEAGRWAVVCERHGRILNVQTLAQAKRELTYDISDWCDECRSLDNDNTNGDSMSTEETKTYASESDVAHDLLAIIDEAPYGRLVGSDETTIESVELIKQPISGSATRIVVELSSGQKFKLDVREIESAS